MLIIHFLHIGKTAGTQIKFICEQINISKSIKIIKHGHKTNLIDLPKNEDYFFSIRDPISRFKSGFYSRKRKGQPRNYCEWSKNEKIAFTAFEHANDLAERLYDLDDRGNQARKAINSISHCAKKQVEWFAGTNNFLSFRSPIWIIEQENFLVDVEILLKKVDFQEKIKITTNPLEAHVNDYQNTPNLSEKAKENLRRWYKQDFEFYLKCKKWKIGRG